MHYHVEIWIPKHVSPGRMEDYINDAMAPYAETGCGACDDKYTAFEDQEEEMVKEFETRILDGDWIRENHPDWFCKVVCESFETVEEYAKEFHGVERDPKTNRLGYWTNPNSFWDWYQVGGRWKGEHTKGYDPREDPEHQETCDICKGTGRRPDVSDGNWEEYKKSTGGCNGCEGKGQRVSWPTEWGPHEGDIMPLDKVSDDQCCYYLVADGKVHMKETWNGKEFEKGDLEGKTIKEMLKEQGITDGFLATVDCHS